MIRPPLLLLFSLAVAAMASAADITLPVSVVDSKGKPVEDVVFSLTPTDGAAVPIAAPTSVEIVQKNETFLPLVTVVPVGTSVAFPNEDTVQHHIYSLSKAKRFEKPLYPPGARESVVFDQPGLITIGCNIHDWMLAYVVVVPTPYFAKTDSAGTAALTAPSGKYRLEIWHSRLAVPQTEEISLSEGTAAPRAFTLTLKPDRRIRRGPEAKAGGY